MLIQLQKSFIYTVMLRQIFQPNTNIFRKDQFNWYMTP